MTVMRSMSNDHGHLARVGAWCWTEIGRTGKASMGKSWMLAFWYMIGFYIASLSCLVLYNLIFPIQILMINRQFFFYSLLYFLWGTEIYSVIWILE